MKKIMGAIAITALMLTAPLLISTVDAESNTIRMSDTYVDYSMFPYKTGMILDSASYIYLKADNPHLKATIDYVMGKDVDISVSYENDDRKAEFKPGEDLYVFRSGSRLDPVITIFVEGDDEPYTSSPLAIRAPYSGGLFVKAGDNYSIKVSSAVDNYGDSVQCYIIRDNTQIFLDETYHGYSSITTEFKMNTMKVGPTSYYVDVTYDAEGFSTPNGSPMMFVAICSAITIGVMLLMFYAGLRPKWSR